MKQINNTEIVDLLKKGYNEERISFEFDISPELIQVLKERFIDNHIEENTQTLKNEEVKTIKSDENNKDIKSENLTSVISSISNNENNPIILRIKKYIQEIETTLNIKILSKNLNQLMKELRELEKYTLTIEQLKTIYAMLDFRIISELRQEDYGKIDNYKQNFKLIVERMLAKSINVKINDVQDIEELKQLAALIPQKNDIIFVNVRNRINKKISDLQQKNAIERIRNDIPLEIVNLVKGIASSEIDIETVNSIIEQEANKRYENSPKTKFSLTIEQHKKQIVIQIKKILKEKANLYPIKDADFTVDILYQLSGDKINSISNVITNFIARKEFSEAKAILKRYSNNLNDEQYISAIKREIEKSESNNISTRTKNERKR